MNTHDTDTRDTDSADRPLGYWLKAVDRLMAAEFAAAFENEGVTRRDWRILNVVDGSVPAERRLPEHKLGRLIERGWIVRADEGWALTDEGRAAKERLGTIVDGIRLKVADAVSPEDLATTIAALEQIATAYGWEEGVELPRGRRRGPRHGRGSRHGEPGRGPWAREGHAPEQGSPFWPHDGFRPHDGFWSRDGFRSRGGFPPRDDHGRGGFGPFEGVGPQHDPRHGVGPHGGHGRLRAARAAQHAYERGFDAGFDRGSRVR